jgi:hypothetical protein
VLADRAETRRAGTPRGDRVLAPGTRTEAPENEGPQKKIEERKLLVAPVETETETPNRSCAQIETGYEPKTSSGNSAGQKFRATLSGRGTAPRDLRSNFLARQ